MLKILLISAVDQEITDLVHKCSQEQHHLYSRFTYREKWEVNAVTCGVGMINAAMVTGAYLDRYKYDEVWMVGCCGGYDKPIGDVIIATEEINADLGIQEENTWVSPENFPFPIVKGQKQDYSNRFPCYQYDAINKEYFDVHYGTLLSTSTVSGSFQHAEKLQNRFNAIGESMEGAAVAQVCAYYGIKFIEVRGISNKAGERCKSNWDFSSAWKNSQAIVFSLWNQILA